MEFQTLRNQEDQGHVAWHCRIGLRDAINNDLIQKLFRIIFLLVTFVALNVLVAIYNCGTIDPKSLCCLNEEVAG